MMRKAVMINAVPTFGFFIGEWHQVFAWWPVLTYDHRKVWLRKVWRRRCVLKTYIFNPYSQDTWWVYSLDEES